MALCLKARFASAFTGQQYPSLPKGELVDGSYPFNSINLSWAGRRISVDWSPLLVQISFVG